MLQNQRNIHWYLAALLCCVSLATSAQIIQDTIGVSDTQTSSVRSARIPVVLPGDNKVINGSKQYVPDQTTGSSFSFEDAPIADVVRTIVGDVMKANFVLHPPIQGAVTLNTRQAVSSDDALYMLDTILFANGLVMAKDARGTFHIGRQDVVRNVGVPVRQTVGKILAPGYGTIIIQPKFIGAAEVAAILKPLVPVDAIVRVDSVRNLLVLVGNRAQAEGWLDLVSTFDVDILKGMSVGVFPLKHVSVADVELALKLFSGSSAPSSASPTASSTPGNPTPVLSTSALAGGSKDLVSSFGAMRVVSLEQINSILVVTPIASNLEVVKSWIDKLDKPNIGSTEPQLHVYPVQNGSAKYLSTVLVGLFGDGKASTATGGTGVAPGLPTVAGSTRSTNSIGGSFAAPVGAGSTTAVNASLNRQQPIAGTLFANIRVMSDDINNMILVWSSYADFMKIESTLKKLDLPPTQVLIEASIIEVTLTDDLQYGLQWKFNDKLSSPSGSGTGVLSNVGGGVLGTAAAGFSYTFKNSLGDVRAVLNALAEKSLVKVISSPSLMVLDNHLATISVGNQQPIKAGETVGSDGLLRSSNIQYKDTGVNLAVTPSVNSSNLVSMQIDQNVTDVGAVDSATGQRAFLQRQISSKVAVRSGETLVLGGLIRDNSTTGKTGVPLLQDIPLLGNLFATNSSNGTRTELLVVITPRVVRSDIDIRSVGNELREKMQGIRLMYDKSGFEQSEGKMQ